MSEFKRECRVNFMRVKFNNYKVEKVETDGFITVRP